MIDLSRALENNGLNYNTWQHKGILLYDNASAHKAKRTRDLSSCGLLPRPCDMRFLLVSIISGRNQQIAWKVLKMCSQRWPIFWINNIFTNRVSIQWKNRKFQRSYLVWAFQCMRWKRPCNWYLCGVLLYNRRWTVSSRLMTLRTLNVGSIVMRAYRWSIGFAFWTVRGAAAATVC